MVKFTKVWYNNCKQLLYALRADWKCFRLAAYAATGRHAPIIPFPPCGHGIITASSWDKHLLFQATYFCKNICKKGDSNLQEEQVRKKCKGGLSSLESILVRIFFGRLEFWGLCYARLCYPSCQATALIVSTGRVPLAEWKQMTDGLSEKTERV